MGTPDGRLSIESGWGRKKHCGGYQKGLLLNSLAATRHYPGTRDSLATIALQLAILALGYLGSRTQPQGCCAVMWVATLPEEGHLRVALE